MRSMVGGGNHGRFKEDHGFKNNENVQQVGINDKIIKDDTEGSVSASGDNDFKADITLQRSVLSRERKITVLSAEDLKRKGLGAKESRRRTSEAMTQGKLTDRGGVSHDPQNVTIASNDVVEGEQFFRGDFISENNVSDCLGAHKECSAANKDAIIREDGTHSSVSGDSKVEQADNDVYRSYYLWVPQNSGNLRHTDGVAGNIQVAEGGDNNTVLSADGVDWYDPLPNESTISDVEESAGKADSLADASDMSNEKGGVPPFSYNDVATPIIVEKISLSADEVDASPALDDNVKRDNFLCDDECSLELPLSDPSGSPVADVFLSVEEQQGHARGAKRAEVAEKEGNEAAPLPQEEGIDAITEEVSSLIENVDTAPVSHNAERDHLSLDNECPPELPRSDTSGLPKDGVSSSPAADRGHAAGAECTGHAGEAGTGYNDRDFSPLGSDVLYIVYTSVEPQENDNGQPKRRIKYMISPEERESVLSLWKHYPRKWSLGHFCDHFVTMFVSNELWEVCNVCDYSVEDIKKSGLPGHFFALKIAGRAIWDKNKTFLVDRIRSRVNFIILNLGNVSDMPELDIVKSCTYQEFGCSGSRDHCDVNKVGRDFFVDDSCFSDISWIRRAKANDLSDLEERNYMLTRLNDVYPNIQREMAYGRLFGGVHTSYELGSFFQRDNNFRVKVLKQDVQFDTRDWISCVKNLLFMPEFMCVVKPMEHINAAKSTEVVIETQMDTGDRAISFNLPNHASDRRHKLFAKLPNYIIQINLGDDSIIRVSWRIAGYVLCMLEKCMVSAPYNAEATIPPLVCRHFLGSKMCNDALESALKDISCREGDEEKRAGVARHLVSLFSQLYTDDVTYKCSVIFPDTPHSRNARVKWECLSFFSESDKDFMKRLYRLFCYNMTDFFGVFLNTMRTLYAIHGNLFCVQEKKKFVWDKKIYQANCLCVTYGGGAYFISPKLFQAMLECILCCVFIESNNMFCGEEFFSPFLSCVANPQLLKRCIPNVDERALQSLESSDECRLLRKVVHDTHCSGKDNGGGVCAESCEGREHEADIILSVADVRNYAKGAMDCFARDYDVDVAQVKPCSFLHNPLLLARLCKQHQWE